MSGAKLYTLAGLVVMVAALVAGVLVLRSGADKADGPKDQPAAAGPSGPQAELAPSPEAPSAKPKVSPYATNLTGKRTTTRPEAAHPSDLPSVPNPEYATGCDYDYGTLPQCVPWKFPADFTTPLDKCEWLADQGLTKLIAGKRDRHGLDPDKNGIACDAGV